MRQTFRFHSSVLVPAVMALCVSATGAKAQTATLPDLVVSASRVPLPPAQVGSSVTSFTGEEIEARGVPLVSDLLREVPGVAVSRFGGLGSSTDIRIRGAESNHTLVVIDGIEMNDPSAGSQFEFGDLLAGGIDRLEVLRGPQSALYGSDAIGGVVNIVTPRGRGPLTAAGAVEAGSFETRRAQARLSGGGERHHFAFSGSGLHTDGISDANEDRGNSEEDAYSNTTGHMRLGVEPTDALSLELVARYTRAKDDTDGFLGGPGAVDDDSKTHSLRRAGRVQASYALFGGDWEHIVGAAISDDQRDNYVAGTHDSLFDGRKVRFDYQSNIRFTTETGVDAEHTVVLMADHEDETVKAQSAFVDVDRDIASNGFAAEYRIGLMDRLFLSAGLRHDDNDLFDDATTWRGTAAYLLPRLGTRIHASAGSGVKNPTIFELFGFTPTFTGNPNLQPEESEGFDAGVEQTFWNGRAVADVTYFRNRIDNLIFGSGTTAVNMPGTSKVDGVETSLRLQPTDALDITASYTYTDGEDSTGTELIRRPRHQASLFATYDFRLAGRPAQAGLGVDYYGEQTDRAFDAFFNTSIVTLSSHTLVRLLASWEVCDGVEVFGRLENALDEDYEEIFTYGTPGRAVYAGVRARF